MLKRCKDYSSLCLVACRRTLQEQHMIGTNPLEARTRPGYFVDDTNTHHKVQTIILVQVACHAVNQISKRQIINVIDCHKRHRYPIKSYACYHNPEPPFPFPLGARFIRSCHPFIIVRRVPNVFLGCCTIDIVVVWNVVAGRTPFTEPGLFCTSGATSSVLFSFS